jgi:PAS domain S-box-containing protein
MIKIAIIIPEDLIKTAEAAALEFKEHISIMEGSMESGLDSARKYEDEGFDVIIARGGTQLLLKSSGIKVPTVPIPVTPIDIFNAIKEAEKVDRNIAIIAFNNMLPASESFVEIAGRKLQIIQVASEKEVEEKISNISNNGIKVVVGGGIVARYAPKHNVKPIVIKTGKEAIVSAIEEAIRLAIATREENKRGERFRIIVENSNDGIISIDRDGFITIFNNVAEKFLNIKCNEVIGKHIDNVLPQIELTEVFDIDIGETEIIKNINDNKLMVSKIPIKVNDQVTDAVAMLHDVNRIQQMEEKIRREIFSTGHYAKYTFDDIIGRSKGTIEIIRIGKEYANVNSTILIEGETGTGKEVMAQSIHNYSKKADGPFVAVNCAALPENLLESELFGYVPGAFTGADKKGKQGLFEQAHGGTIFLDEISEINPLLQGRLLRILQEKQVMRVGDNKLIPIDVRVIAATNRNLHKLIKEKAFREDLYYRLNVLNIELIPLRNKKEDIPYFVNNFIQHYSHKLDKPAVILSAEAMKYLSRYNWPGNVREIRNVVERLMVIAKKTYIDLEDIEGKLIIVDKSNRDEPIIQIDTERLINRNEITTREPERLYSSEKEAILCALEENMGIINFAAKALGISRTTLWRKMKKYNLEVSR